MSRVIGDSHGSCRKHVWLVGSRQWKPTVTAASRAYGLSRQHIYRLLKRYELGGLDAVEPRSRRPASNPNSVPDDVITAIVELREKLVADGLDAGPLTLQWHLAQAHQPHHPIPIATA